MLTTCYSPKQSLPNYGKYIKHTKKDLILESMTGHILNSLLSSHPVGIKKKEKKKNEQNRKVLAQPCCTDSALCDSSGRSPRQPSDGLPRGTQAANTGWDAETQLGACPKASQRGTSKNKPIELRRHRAPENSGGFL